MNTYGCQSNAVRSCVPGRLVLQPLAHTPSATLAADFPAIRSSMAQAIAHGTYKGVGAFQDGRAVMHTGVSGTGRVAFAGYGVFMNFVAEGFRQPAHVSLLRHPLSRYASEVRRRVNALCGCLQLCA